MLSWNQGACAAHAREVQPFPRSPLPPLSLPVAWLVSKRIASCVPPGWRAIPCYSRTLNLPDTHSLTRIRTQPHTHTLSLSSRFFSGLICRMDISKKNGRKSSHFPLGPKLQLAGKGLKLHNFKSFCLTFSKCFCPIFFFSPRRPAWRPSIPRTSTDPHPPSPPPGT